MENVELRHCGQAGLDRNVIDFLYAGDVTGSYVRTSSMRDSFNNALNIRGTNGGCFSSMLPCLCLNLLREARNLWMTDLKSAEMSRSPPQILRKESFSVLANP